MRILVAIDDSEPARTALEHVLEHYPDAEVTLIHVINPIPGLYGGDTVYNYPQLIETGKKRADELFEEAAELVAASDRSITTETVVGDPARGIVDHADDGDYDLIVVGSHGRSGVSRVLLGSVAEKIVRRSPIPVTVVR